MDAIKLSDIEIQRELGALPGWSRKGDALAKTFAFANFVGAIAFVNRTAQVAERMDHHPDLDIRYTKIAVTLSTHSAGGITAKDVALAKELERLSA